MLGIWYFEAPDIRMSRRVKDGVLCAGALVSWWEEYGESGPGFEGEALKEGDFFMREKRMRLLFVWAELDYFWSLACRECDSRYNAMEVWEDSEEKFMEDDVAEVKRITRRIHTPRESACSNFKKFVDLLISG